MTKLNKVTIEVKKDFVEHKLRVMVELKTQAVQ